jgi:serine O-acetyltransferase
VRLYARAVRPLLLPLLLGARLTDRQDLIDADVRRWLGAQPDSSDLLDLLSQPEFRNLYYHRLANGNTAGRIFQRVARGIYRPEATLHLTTTDIGPGLYIQHGFATIIAAKRVGANCWVNQQVTIGFTEDMASPVLEDDVTVSAGAKVIGGVTVGRGARVGANAVVVRDVAPGATAVGVPAHRN